MKIQDAVYGKIEVKEPVLLDLIKSKPLQRLKGVNQAGSQLVFPHITTTRFEHSIGVMNLLKIKGANLEEQIAGLLHDVPHTAFSHAMDYVFSSGHLQTYHEQFLGKMIFKSEIPKILKKYGFDPSRVIEDHHFPLLEQLLPALCADRIDYSIRDLMLYKKIDKEKAQKYLSNIIIYKNKFVMKDKKVALDFARKYISQSENCWISAKTMVTFQILADAVKRGLEKKMITEEDLFLQDQFFLKKLKNLKDEKIQQKLRLLTPKLKIIETSKNYDYFLKGKIRYIDPQVLINNHTEKLSSIYKEFKDLIEDYLVRMKKGHYIKIES